MMIDDMEEKGGDSVSFESNEEINEEAIDEASDKVIEQSTDQKDERMGTMKDEMSGMNKERMGGMKEKMGMMQDYLRGVNYPAMKQDMIDMARSNKAPDDVISMMDKLPDKTYKEQMDVEKEFGKIM